MVRLFTLFLVGFSDAGLVEVRDMLRTVETYFSAGDKTDSRVRFSTSQQETKSDDFLGASYLSKCWAVFLIKVG